jgi:hypothetical protein
MRATLHDPAPNTYYGQWSREKRLFPGLESAPLPMMSARQAPDSGLLAFRSETSPDEGRGSSDGRSIQATAV